MRRLVLLWLCLVPWVAPQAHLLNMTTVEVDVDARGRLTVDLKIDLTRAAGGSLDYYRLSRVAHPLEDRETRALLDRLAGAVGLQAGGDSVVLQVRSAELPASAKEVFLEPLSWPMTHLVLEGTLPVAQSSGAALTAVFRSGFHFEEPIALTFRRLADDHRMTRWLVTSQTSPPFLDAQPLATPLRRFVVFGFLHILPRGLDHVLFVLGLYLGARTLKSLLILVTSFTLAHSITLGLAGLGLVRLPPGIVEPLISLSIVWIAVENVGVSGARNYRPAWVFGFGLLHGLGFASALSALQAPQGSFLAALLSFNVGIELGQLTVIAVAFALTFWCRRNPGYRRWVVVPASVSIAAVAALWTLQRLLA